LLFLPLSGFISAQSICETLISQYSVGSLWTTIAIFKGFSWFGFTATTAEKKINLNHYISLYFDIRVLTKCNEITFTSCSKSVQFVILRLTTVTSQGSTLARRWPIVGIQNVNLIDVTYSSYFASQIQLFIVHTLRVRDNHYYKI